MSNNPKTKTLPIRMIAVDAGEALKWSTTLNEVNRVACAIFPFSRKSFPNASITSERSQLVHDWIMTLGTHKCSPSTRSELLCSFLDRLASDGEPREQIRQMLERYGLELSTKDTDASSRFDSRDFHPVVVQHCRDLFGQGNYFHAVFEATKAYNNLVKSKAKSTRDGESLMMSVWDPGSGVLKVTACLSETDRNVQDGIKFLSAGLMRAMRNPAAHQTALEWPISEQDATDILAFVSFLLRQHDKAVYVP